MPARIPSLSLRTPRRPVAVVGAGLAAGAAVVLFAGCASGGTGEARPVGPQAPVETTDHAAGGSAGTVAAPPVGSAIPQTPPTPPGSARRPPGTRPNTPGGPGSAGAPVDPPTPTVRVPLKTGGIGDVAFGTGQDAALAALAPVLGPPAFAGTPRGVCGPRTTARWDDAGLTAYFTDGRFDGWHLGGAPKVSAYMDTGVTLDSTMGQVRTTYGARFTWIDGSSLGNEWVVDRYGNGGTSVAGLADGRGDGARVTQLWAGDTCIAR